MQYFQFRVNSNSHTLVSTTVVVTLRGGANGVHSLAASPQTATGERLEDFRGSVRGGVGRFQIDFVRARVRHGAAEWISVIV